MNFRFTKELIGNSSTNRPDKQLKLYKIFDDREVLRGQFFYYPEKQIISFENREILIEVGSKFFKKTKYLLTDKKDGKQVGEYEISGGIGISLFWQDVPTLPTGKVILNNMVFNFRRIAPDVSYSSLKQEYWNYFKFRLYAVKGDEFYDYSLKLDTSIVSKSNLVKHRPFIGAIESNSDNVFAILAGLYLMEIEFDNEDGDIG